MPDQHPDNKLYAATLLSAIHEDTFYQNYIFEVAFSFATRYGFQAFNPNPLLSIQQKDAELQAANAGFNRPDASELLQQQHMVALQAALSENSTRRDDPEWARTSWASTAQELRVSLGLRRSAEAGVTPAPRKLDVGGLVGIGIDENGVVRQTGLIPTDVQFGGAVPLVDPPYVASTLFITADHLCRVLVDDLMVRNCCINGVDMDTAFGEAVWILHSKLLAAYVKWAENVMDLPVRPMSDTLNMARKSHTDESVLRMLLAEITLFLLIYTESANVRHLTDGLSFLFWVARFSPDFQDALNICPLPHTADSCDVEYNLRDSVLQFRNECAAQIDAAARTLQIGVASPEGSDAHQVAQSCFLRFQQELHGPDRKSPLKMLTHAMHLWQERGAFDEYLVSWVFAISEERPFLEEVIQPMFHFMAYLEDKLGRQGWETQSRLCYEDFNDSLCHPQIVRNTLALLGVADPNDYNTAYSALCGIGRREEGGVDLDKAAVWWEACVVRKMFLERRGYMRLFRDYFYGHAIPVILFHFLVVFFFTAGAITPYNICETTNTKGAPATVHRTNCFNLIPLLWTSVVVTHAILLAARDFTGTWLSRPARVAPSFAEFVQIDPSTVRLLPESVVISSSDSAPSSQNVANFLSASPWGVSIKQIGTVPLFGIPSILRATAVCLVFFGQFAPGTTGKLLHTIWYPLAVVYSVLTLWWHWAFTADGFMLEKSHFGFINRIMSLFQANNHRYGDPSASVLRVGKNSHFRTIALWFISLPAGFIFSYLAIYTMQHELQMVALKYNLFHRGSWHWGGYDTGLPVPGNVTLVAVTILICSLAACFGLVFFTVLMFGSQIMASVYLKRHGFAHYKNWAQLCESFDEAAALWCRKSMHRTDGAKKGSKSDDDEDGNDSEGKKASQREHNTFSLIWNTVVEDFYHRDQLSLCEAEALSYLRVAPDQDTQVDMQFPTVWMPPFVMGPRLNRELCLSSTPSYCEPTSALPPAMVDTLKLVLWVLHSGGVLDAPELTLLVQPLLGSVPENAINDHFLAAQDLIREGLAFMSDLCRGHLVDAALQSALQVYLEASHPELDLEVEFAFANPRGDAQPDTPNTQIRMEALGSIADCVQKGMEEKPDLATAVRYLAQLSVLHEWRDSEPEIEDVEGHLRTFVKLLHHDKLGHKGVCPAACMSPYTTLVPVYKEGVLPCLEEESATKLMGFGAVGQMPETLDTAKVWLGMLTEIEPGVSQLSYIQTMHPLEWRNFQCRIAAQTGLMSRDVAAEKFLAGEELHEYEWELLTWFAGRTQLLGRQLPALATYYKAAATLLALECPCPHDWTVEQYYDWLKQATGVKYQAILCLQILGEKLLHPQNARDLWDAKAMIAMLNHYPFLRGLCLFDVDLPGGDSVQYSVMLQGKYRDVVQEGLIPPRGSQISLATYPSPSILATSEWCPDPSSGYRPFSISEQYTTALQPVYSIRLPRNYYSERGVIIGSGKPENHNIGMPYVFTDLLQGNDSNMDNLVADALKMRNIVSEHMVVDRFSTVFIPLLKSQVLNEPGMYEVKYQTKPKAAPLTRGISLPSFSQAASTTMSFMKRFNSQISHGGSGKGALKKPARVPVKPKGVADGWEHESGYRRVVGGVKYTGKAASILQYTVAASKSSSSFTTNSSSEEGTSPMSGSSTSMTTTTAPSTHWSSRRSDPQNIRPRTHKQNNKDRAFPEPVKPAQEQPASLSGSTYVHVAANGPWSGNSSSGDDGDTIKSFVMQISQRLQQRGKPESGVAFADLQNAMKSVADGPHLAVLGINPWVCTRTQGNFAWLNALNEAFFTFNIQSQLQYSSRIRYHYGLGDMWNKFWAITNSGVSRPCTNLHAVEDLPVGVRVVLKGGIIKLRDYLLVGKCRETHLVGMLSYMYKICSGGYESSLGRDYYLLHSKFDPFREATSWQSITGMVVMFRLWFMGAWLRLHVEMLLLIMGDRNTMYGKDLPDHFAMLPSWFPMRSNLNAWDVAVLGFWTLLLPFFLYGSAITLQHGVGRTLRDMLRLHSTLWPMLNFVFGKWWDSVAHMSCHHQMAQYVATGRTFGLHHIPFVYKYCIFSHTLWYYAVIMVTAGAILVCDTSYFYSHHTYGYMVTLFVIFTGVMQLCGPFWYTPLSFSLGHVMRDAGDWWAWMHGQVDAYTSTSYHQWRIQQLEPFHNLSRLVEGFHISWLFYFFATVWRNGVITAFCIHVVYLSSPTQDVIVQFMGQEFGRYTSFAYGDMAFVMLFCTAVFWGLLFLLCVGHRLACAAAQREARPLASMFLTVFGMIAAGVSLVACYQPFILPVGVSVPWYLIAKNMFAIVAGNFLCLGIALQFLQVFRWEPVLWLVECIYWGIDLLLGLAMQGVLILLSLTPLTQWLQNETINAGFGYSSAMCQTD